MSFFFLQHFLANIQLNLVVANKFSMWELAKLTYGMMNVMQAAINAARRPPASEVNSLRETAKNVASQVAQLISRSHRLPHVGRFCNLHTVMRRTTCAATTTAVLELLLVDVRPSVRGARETLRPFVNNSGRRPRPFRKPPIVHYLLYH